MANAPKDPLDHVPSAVEQARRDAGLSKSELARQAHVSLPLISMIEKGTRNAVPALIDTIAGILDVPPERLKRRDGSPGTRLAKVCVRCSEVWAPRHECPTERAA